MQKEVELKVYIDYQEDESKVYQNFRLLLTNNKYLRYFYSPNFSAYYILEEEVSKHYIGDLSSLIYEKRIMFNNLLTLVYIKKSNVKKEYKSTQFMIYAPIPMTEGCHDCTYWTPKHKKCSYYEKINIYKEQCPDFRQKEIDVKNDELLEKIAEELGVNVSYLLETFGTPEEVIKKYQKGELRLLNEEEKVNR